MFNGAWRHCLGFYIEIPKLGQNQKIQAIAKRVRAATHDSQSFGVLSEMRIGDRVTFKDIDGRFQTGKLVRSTGNGLILWSEFYRKELLVIRVDDNWMRA